MKKEPLEKIIVKGARTHNLKNINVEMPRNKMLAITGVSGSGKSSLAFDTIFAEGQRRYAGILIFLRATIFKSDAQAGCGRNHRSLAGDFHRSKIPLQQSAFHGGDHHRNL